MSHGGLWYENFEGHVGLRLCDCPEGHVDASEAGCAVCSDVFGVQKAEALQIIVLLVE